jgi:hypothetical protein
LPSGRSGDRRRGRRPRRRCLPRRPLDFSPSPLCMSGESGTSEPMLPGKGVAARIHQRTAFGRKNSGLGSRAGTVRSAGQVGRWTSTPKTSDVGGPCNLHRFAPNGKALCREAAVPCPFASPGVSVRHPPEGATYPHTPEAARGFRGAMTAQSFPSVSSESRAVSPQRDTHVAGDTRRSSGNPAETRLSSFRRRGTGRATSYIDIRRRIEGRLPCAT